MRLRSSVATLFLAGLAGCASCSDVPADAVTDCNAQVVPGGAATDILFVIDDSFSMREEQDELSTYLGGFIDQLLGSAIALDIHVGVTNTSVEDYSEYAGTAMGYGRLVAGFPGATGTPYPAGALVAIEQDPQGVGTAGHFLWGTAYDEPAHLTSTWGGTRMLSSATSSGADLARHFKANVKQGVWGSNREQPLAATRRALEQAGCPGPNCGFLRAGARLAVVVLTDEDDCSGPRQTGAGAITGDGACQNPANWGRLDPLADFVAYLDTTIGGPEGQKPIVALIAGFDATGAVSMCRGADRATAAQALPRRLDAFLDLVEPAPNGARTRTMKASICRPFDQILLGIASMIIPQTMPLRQAPQDYRMLAVSVRKATGVTQPCAIQLAGTADAPAADVIYAPAPAGGLPSLTFQGDCRLAAGDQVDIRIVCAR